MCWCCLHSSVWRNPSTSRVISFGVYKNFWCDKILLYYYHFFAFYACLLMIAVFQFRRENFSDNWLRLELQILDWVNLCWNQWNILDRVEWLVHLGDLEKTIQKLLSFHQFNPPIKLYFLIFSLLLINHKIYTLFITHQLMNFIISLKIILKKYKRYNHLT